MDRVHCITIQSVPDGLQITVSSGDGCSNAVRQYAISEPALLLMIEQGARALSALHARRANAPRGAVDHIDC